MPSRLIPAYKGSDSRFKIQGALHINSVKSDSAHKLPNLHINSENRFCYVIGRSFETTVNVLVVLASQESGEGATN